MVAAIATGRWEPAGRTQSWCRAYQAVTVDWRKSLCPEGGAWTNVRVRPFGDHAGSKVSSPGRAGTGAQAAVASVQISTAPELSYVTIQIDGGLSSNVNTKPPKTVLPLSWATVPLS